MTHKNASEIIKKWEQEDPIKFRAWTMFGLGAQQTIMWNADDDAIQTPPLGYLVGHFENHWGWQEHLDNYVDEGPPYDNLRDSETIGGIITRTNYDE